MAFEVFKILIIDDDPTAVLLYRKIFEKYHYQVVEARDGVAGVQAAFRENPDIIILDIMMPRMTGHEVCRALRTAPRTAGIPIIMLTGLSGAEARRKAQEVGADDFLTKAAASPDQVEGHIKMLLKQRVQASSRSWLADLPGSVAIDYVLIQQLGSGQNFVVSQLQIKNFTTYTELLGYRQAEFLLWKFARLLTRRVIDDGRGSDFVGYSSWDSFVLVTDPENGTILIDRLLQDFKEMMQDDPSQSEAANYRPVLAIAQITVNRNPNVHLGLLHNTLKSLLADADLCASSIRSTNF